MVDRGPVIRGTYGLGVLCLMAAPVAAQTVPLYSVYELTFEGPTGLAKPAAEVQLLCTWEGPGQRRISVQGFWDGGSTWRCRFTPTKVGPWRLTSVVSERPELARQHVGLSLRCTPSKHRGFWEAEGRYWRRSNGSYEYFVGNTHYTFLINPAEQIVADLRGNRQYFGKVRFSICGDRYEDPELKAFLKPDGTQTNESQYADSPNPEYFQERVDVAVRTGFEEDLICDLIMSGPDKHRRQLEQGAYIRYVAARYGAYPNVWFCVANEWDQVYQAAQVKAFGEKLRSYLAYPTPVSVHSTPRVEWDPRLNGDWCDHATIQKKLKSMTASADAIRRAREACPGKPAINDENSYQGKGDGHTHDDTIEAIFGSFMGGGYATTSYKPANKQGQYFFGKFNVEEHTSAPHLKFLADYINEHVDFWRLEPGDRHGVFEVPDGFRVLEDPGREYIVGCNGAASMTAKLPQGLWQVTRVDLFAMETNVIAKHLGWAPADREFSFRSHDSRAQLLHFEEMRSKGLLRIGG